MKKKLIVTLLIAAGSIFTLIHKGQIAGDTREGQVTGETQEEPSPEPADALAEALAMNSERYAPPPAPRRRGHVKPRPLDAKAVRPQENGFTIRLPSQAPVTSPAVYQGKVFVSGGFRSREFYAFDARTGKLAWGLELDDDGPSTAACDDGICTFNTESCTIFTVEAATGKLLWAWWLGDPLMSAPAIADGRVFTSYPAAAAVAQNGLAQNSLAQNVVQNTAPAPNATPPAVDGAAKVAPGLSHALAAFDLESGEVLWQRWIDGDVISAPVADGDELFVATFAGTVYRFDQATGRILSARRERATSAPTVSGDGVYFSKRTEADGEAVEEALAGVRRQGGKVFRMMERKVAPYLDGNVQRGSGMWLEGVSDDAANGFSGGAPEAAKAAVAFANVGQASVSTLQKFQGSRVLKLGEWTYSTMGDEVVGTSTRDGESRWSHKLAGDLKKTGGFLATPPVDAGQGLLIVTISGEIVLLDPKDGRKLTQWRLDAPVRSQPVVEDGWIYVGTEDGRLVALDTGERGLTGWPMWGGGAERNG